MTKIKYLSMLQQIYYTANMSDSDNPDKADWLDADACAHQCRSIDQMLLNLVDGGSITAEEFQTFYDTLGE